VRNVLIAIGNSGDPLLAREAERLLDDASPLVRGAAVWALGRLDPARLRSVAIEHDDPSMQEELNAALAETKGSVSKLPN
jgi:epoxyqueuosine reductase